MKRFPFLLFAFLNLSFFSVEINAQNLILSKNNTSVLEGNIQRERMKKDGLSDAEIDTWLMQQKSASLKKINTTTQPMSTQPPAIYANSCGDIGAENGWSAWKASTGNYFKGVVTWSTGQTPFSPRFNITVGTRLDPCAPGPALGSLPIPVVAPGFGKHSIQLGQIKTNGNDGNCYLGCAEQLSYSLTITTADTNFLYTYAIVMENPTPVPNRHTLKEVPYAEIYILDQSGTIIPCSHQKYIGDTTGTGILQPGFNVASCDGPANNGTDVVYKPGGVQQISIFASPHFPPHQVERGEICCTPINHGQQWV